MNGTRLGSYEAIKRAISRNTGIPVTNPIVSLTAGASAGIIGSIFANPFYITKTRLQSQSSFAPVGQQYEYKGGYDALKCIIKSDGIAGLFRGAFAACVRISVASMTQLTSYDVSKRAIIYMKLPWVFG